MGIRLTPSRSFEPTPRLPGWHHSLLAFGLLEHWKVPPWVVVAASAAAGQWLLGA